MKNLRFLAVTSLILLAAAVTSVFAQRAPSDLSEPSQLSFSPPKPVLFTLSNGIQVYYFQDRELPLVTLTAMFKGGGLYEPTEKSGLASLTGTVMRTGGSVSRPGDKLDEELEFLAASVETGMGREYASASANCLKKDFSKVLEIYADILANPAFPQEKLDLARNQMKEQLRRRWDMPAQGANTLFTDKSLGGTAWGTRPNFKTLNAVTREDLAAFHQRFIAPNNMYLGVVGDITKEEAQKELETAFKGWAKRKVTMPAIPALVEKADGTVYYAYKDTPQANMVIGHLGARNNCPEEAALDVLNEIFGGGGFTARLMKEVRSNRGLTYGIYGGVNTGRDRGMFRIASQLKAAKFVEAMKLVKSMVTDIETKEVTDEEMDVAKKSIANSFVFEFESKERLAARYIQLKLDGYPDNYFETYIPSIKKVTKQDILAAAKKYMDPDRAIIVVVGDEKLFDKPLAELGKVVPIDYKATAEADRAEK
jgi:zinc protease